MTVDESDAILTAALHAVAGQWDGAGYRFSAAPGATMATVWRGYCDSGAPEVALRLTPKPEPLIRRIADFVDGVDGVECPRTDAVASMDHGGRTWTVQVCTWIGKGAAERGDPVGLGRGIAQLHREFARLADAHDFSDRGLSFERAPVDPSDFQMPSWYVARRLWRDRVDVLLQSRLPIQPIHGDMHWGNVVTGSDSGYGFIDFDKIMFAPVVFDLAKLLATGFFRIPAGSDRPVAKFDKSRAADLLLGYQQVRRLTEAELAALEGFALLLNEETARLGLAYDNPDYLQQATAVGSWWTSRRRQTGDPFGLRPVGRTATEAGEQLDLFRSH